MLNDARYKEERERMQTLKRLYISRHYTQCAKYGERLLDDFHVETHPIHLAYLNFYTALSHDTLAREATLKNRYKELNLAEKHYMAAIATLVPQDDQISSPTSSSAPEDHTWKVRRSSNAGSFDSSTSAASSATAYSVHDAELQSSSKIDYSPSEPDQFQFPSPPRASNRLSTPMSKCHLITITPSRPETPEEHHFVADVAAFVRMLRSHLANVQELKDNTEVHSVRFQCTSPILSPSPTTSKARSSHWFVEEDMDARESIRRSRRSVKFRPRFDPESVRRLCNEALAELS